MTGESHSHDSGIGRSQRPATQRGRDVRESNASRPAQNDGGQASGREDLFREGLDHYQNGEYTRAIRAWEILLEEFPEDRAALHPGRSLEAQEIAGRLQVAMARLSPRERIVFEMKHCQGMKLRDIGEMCGTSEEAAKNSLFRALQKLRTDLQDLV